MIGRPSSTGPFASRVANPLIVVLCAALSACLSTRDEAQQVPQGDGACAIKCHGDGKTAAPPVDLDGNSDDHARGVGAHRRHLEASDTHVAFPCETCHAVPATTDAPGHADSPRPAEVRLTGLAVQPGSTAAYDASTLRCADSYCHGGPRAYAWPAAAVWNDPKSPADACGTSCHALPPGGTHPAADACEVCHTDTAGPNHTIKDRTLHINGRVDVNAKGCNACHGNDENNAPPKDLAGSSDTTHVGVGAHQTHLAGGAFSKPVACDACHVVPNDPGAPGHMDTALPAEVTFGGLATQDSSPTWDRGTETCSNTYCHGSGSMGGANIQPKWTSVDGSQAVCGSCHALPPPAPHIASDRCELCHSETVAPGFTIVHREKHIDGVVELRSMACDSCHGSATNPAPPLDLYGSSDPTRVTVGAHQTHLSGGTFSRPVECVECHVVPASFDDPGHIDANLPAEVVFSGVAKASNANPSWDRNSAKCTNAYCHGATLPGGFNTSPTWTTVGGGEAGCGACHSLPPPPPHVANTSCELCHLPTAGPGYDIANPATHVDGTLNIQNAPGPCNACHGDATSPAPPADTQGNTATTFPGVGAHRSHLGATRFGKPLACDVCHPVPPLSTVHMNGTANLAFSGIALGTDSSSPIQHSSTPVFNGSPSYTCSQVYCHGDWTEAGHASGAAVPEPQWTSVGSGQVYCGSCHSIPPPAPHPNIADCNGCHPKTVDGQMNLNLDYHLNGVVDFD